jgi:hypothetical protein
VFAHQNKLNIYPSVAALQSLTLEDIALNKCDDDGIEQVSATGNSSNRFDDTNVHLDTFSNSFNRFTRQSVLVSLVTSITTAEIHVKDELLTFAILKTQ